MNEIFNFLEFEVFINENELGKMNFPLGKWNFEPIGNSVHTTEYLALGKVLLARLRLKVKVCITDLLSICNLQNISCLTLNNFVWNFIFFRIPLTLKTYL